QTLEADSRGVHSIAISPDGRQIASGDSSLQVWNRVAGVLTQSFSHHSPHSVAFSPDGQHIISGSFDGTIKVWDHELGVCIHTLKGHTYVVHSVRFSPDGRYIVSGSGDGTIKVWERVSGVCAQTLHDGSPVYSAV